MIGELKTAPSGEQRERFSSFLPLAHVPSRRTPVRCGGQYQGKPSRTIHSVQVCEIREGRTHRERHPTSKTVRT